MRFVEVETVTDAMAECVKQIAEGLVERGRAAFPGLVVTRIKLDPTRVEHDKVLEMRWHDPLGMMPSLMSGCSFKSMDKLAGRFFHEHYRR